MIKYIYAFKNVLSGNFNNPVYEVIDKDNAVEAFSISAKEAPAESKERMKELDLYYLGIFDTKSGKSELVDPEFLLSLKSIIDGEKVA